MHYELSFLRSLVLSIFIETLLLLIIIKNFFKKLNIKTWIVILAGITATFATLPYLWFIIPLFIKTKIAYIIISESLAILLESFILFGMLRIKYRIALIFATICNLISFLIGTF